MLALLLFLNGRGYPCRSSGAIRFRAPPPPAAAATATLVWNGDLPRPLQQILFQAADAITPELAAIGLLAAAVGLAPQVRH